MLSLLYVIVIVFVDSKTIYSLLIVFSELIFNYYSWVMAFGSSTVTKRTPALSKRSISVVSANAAPGVKTPPLKNDNATLSESFHTSTTKASSLLMPIDISYTLDSASAHQK